MTEKAAMHETECGRQCSAQWLSLRQMPGRLAFSLTLSILSSMVGAGTLVDLHARMTALAHEHGFRLDGSEHLREAVGRVAEGPLMVQLRGLLAGVDHIIVQAPEGGVERVLILGVDNTPVSPTGVQTHRPVRSATEIGFPIRLPTRRQGNQHLVRVELEGARSRRLGQELLIDTGADALVLPASMIARLGLSPAELSTREVQTANGRASARYGRLPALWLNGRRVPEVTVAFLDDARLGDHGLLGMSVLGRFRMTIDDQAGHLLLEPR